MPAARWNLPDPRRIAIGRTPPHIDCVNDGWRRRRLPLSASHMEPTLSDADLSTIHSQLSDADGRYKARFGGDSGDRQPVHTVYGGAHLFSAGLAEKLGQLARRGLDAYAPSAAAFGKALELTDSDELIERVHTRVLEKLAREPVEDFRIDFEDGYGNRPDEEEDAHAAEAAGQVAAGMKAKSLPPFIGIRIKPLNEELRRRSLRTLDIFVTELVARAGSIPPGFVITLPKITSETQVVALARVLSLLEDKLQLAPKTLRMEIMVELTQTLMAPDGSCPLPLLLDAADGRLRGAHFGTYDYTASCDITAAHQHMMHPVCDDAKLRMKLAYASTGVWLSDGATNIMPVGPHKAPKGSSLTDAQQAENADVVHSAWRLHYRHTMHSLVGGFYQGWDLHPAQLPIRYAAMYAFFLEGLEPASARLKNFVQKAAQATLVGDVFDDAATGQGLLNFFLRAISCGAITEADACERSGLTRDELNTRSFVKILESRK